MLALSASVELPVGAPLLTVEQADGLEVMELAAPLELTLVAPLEPAAPLRVMSAMELAAPLELELVAPLELELIAAPLEASAPLRVISPMSFAACLSGGTGKMVGRRSGTGNQKGLGRKEVLESSAPLEVAVSSLSASTPMVALALKSIPSAAPL